MEQKNGSFLKFRKYIVKEIHYRTNEMYKPGKERISLDFDFDTHTYFSENNQEMEVELSTELFKNAEEKNYPFEMSAGIKGFFYMEEGNAKIQDFEANAIAILFPYMRAIISTYTANANVVPVILPPMNINAYLRKKNSGENKQV